MPRPAKPWWRRRHDELRRVARGYLRRERPGHLLQTTALLHEAYLRLLRTGPGPADTREAFFRLMASEMRRRLVDHARRRLAGQARRRRRPRDARRVDGVAVVTEFGRRW